MASPRPASPAAIARRASRKDSISSAMPSANSVVSASSALRAVSAIDGSPPFERSPQGDLVGVLEVATYRKSTRQTRHAQAHPGQHAREVRRGGLALEVRVGGQDHLGDRPVGQPAEQLLDPQLVRSDSFDRRDGAPEDVVAALELTGALDRHDVLGLLDHTDHGRVASWVTADAAGLLLRHVAAHGAETDLVLDLDEDLGEPAHVGGGGLEQVEREPLGALRAHTGQPPELVDEVRDDPFVHQKPSIGGAPAPPSGSPPSPPSPPVSGPNASAAIASERARASR